MQTRRCQKECTASLLDNLIYAQNLKIWKHCETSLRGYGTLKYGDVHEKFNFSEMQELRPLRTCQKHFETILPVTILSYLILTILSYFLLDECEI